jgi:hypothetical protein
MSTVVEWIDKHLDCCNRQYISAVEFGLAFFEACEYFNWQDDEVAQAFHMLPIELQVELVRRLEELEPVNYFWRPWTTGEFSDETLEKLRFRTAEVHRILTSLAKK